MMASLPNFDLLTTETLFEVISAIEAVCIAVLLFTNFRLNRTVKRLRKLLERFRRTSYDVYLLRIEFKNILHHTLQLVITKMQAHKVRDPISFTTEAYLNYKKLFVEEVLNHIKNSRLYELLVTDVFSSEEALRSFLEGYFELETLNLYLSETSET